MAQHQINLSLVQSDDDFPHLLKVEKEAYGSSKMMSLLFSPHGAKSQTEDMLELRLERHIDSWKEDPGSMYVKAVTASSEVIGMAVWYFYTEPSFSRNPWAGMRMPQGGNQDLCDHYFGTLVAAREQRYGTNNPYALLANLVVAPAWQRKGVGKLLLQWGLRRADEQGLECWLDASPSGLGLYKKYGWQEVKVLEFELYHWGGIEGDVHRTVCMVRPPSKNLASQSSGSSQDGLHL